ncbi:IclR family transcriptional regulator domain-containing protein [Alsobacter sp. R-9]
MRETWPAPAPAAAGPGGTALVTKALRLLRVIGASSDPVTTAALLAQTGWPRPTLHRILAALVDEGFVRREAGRRGYVPGYRILELAQTIWAGPDLAAAASLELQRLRNLAGETAYLAIPQRDGVLSLGKFESPHPVRSAARLGVLKPFHCTSQGKAILAFSRPDEVDRLLGPGPLPRYTRATIVERGPLDEELGRVRQQGFSIENEEILEGSRCVGAPILGQNGRPVGAVSVAGPAWRLTLERAQQLGPEVAEAGRHIGALWRAARPATPAPGVGAAIDGLPEPAFHGADPVWDGSRSVLVWTDRMAPSIHESDGRATRSSRLSREGAIACALHGTRESLLATDDGLCVVEERQAAVRRLTAGAPFSALARAPDGTVWAACRDGDASRVGALRGGIFDERWTLPGTVSALCWSPDGSRTFASDADRGLIHAGDVKGGRIRVLSRIPRASGRPVALTCDSLGRVWVALADGWSVVRLDDTGEFADVVAMPVPRPTGLAFGGPGGRTLFVTTARYGLARDVLERAPLSGRVLAVPTAIPT